MILHLLDMPRRTGPATRGGSPEAWDKESVTRRQIGLLGDRQRLGIAGVALDIGRLDIDLTWASGSAPANTLPGRS